MSVRSQFTREKYAQQRNDEKAAIGRLSMKDNLAGKHEFQRDKMQKASANAEALKSGR
ncbi:hypothetical protein NGY2020029_29960 [Vibrio cholerae]